MNLKRWAILLAVSAAMLTLFTGCGLQDRFLAQNNPTATATRRPRATFTPRPQATDVPADTATPQATNVPPATSTPVPPTKAPVKATAKPKPTNPPAPPPQPTVPPAPTNTPAPQFPWRFVGEKCTSSGGIYIEIYAYTTYPSDPLAGVYVRASYAPDGPVFGDQDIAPTDDSGKAQFTLKGSKVYPDTPVYAWVYEKSTGRRISPLAGPYTIKSSGLPDNPADCELMQIAFSK